MATTLTVPTSYKAQGQFGSKWYSIYDFELVPQIWKEIFNIYGKAFDMFEFLNIVGQTMHVKGRKMTIFETGTIERPMTLGSAVTTGTAGATISFTLASTDYDVNGHGPLRVGDGILIPRQYQTNTSKDYKYRIMSISTATDPVIVAMPFKRAGTVFTPAQIGVQIPIGTKIAVIGDSYATATSQPRGTTNASWQRTFYTGINKDTWEIEGGIMSQENYLDGALKNGGRGIYNRAQFQAEFNFNAKINHSIWTGEFPDNTLLVDTNKYSESVPILGTQGMQDTIDLLGQKQAYFDQYEIADFDDIDSFMISNGIIADNILFGVGDLLYRDLENSSYDFLKEFSKTDIMSKVDELGIEFRVIKKLGHRFLVKKMSNLSNPNTYGLPAYNDFYRSMGFMVPMGTENISVTLGDDPSPIKLGNMMLGYLGDKGEDRQRVIGVVNGMTGLDGFPIVSPNDVCEGYILSENTLIMSKVNQMIKVYKSA